MGYKVILISQSETLIQKCTNHKQNSKLKLLSSTFLRCCMRWLTFESADKFLMFHYSRAFFSCVTVYYAVQGGADVLFCG